MNTELHLSDFYPTLWKGGLLVIGGYFVGTLLKGTTDE